MIMKQYHTSGRLWQYTFASKECSCGCNLFYHAYDRKKDEIYIVCNKCQHSIETVKDDKVQDELSKGIWK